MKKQFKRKIWKVPIFLVAFCHYTLVCLMFLGWNDMASASVSQKLQDQVEGGSWNCPAGCCHGWSKKAEPWKKNTHHSECSFWMIVYADWDGIAGDKMYLHCSVSHNLSNAFFKMSDKLVWYLNKDNICMTCLSLPKTHTLMNTYSYWYTFL